jgi:hypothetical protein
VFIEFELLDGSKKTIQHHSLLRIRPTVFNFEPENAVMIQYDGRQNFSREPLEDLVERFHPHAPMARLTMLNGDPVWVSVNRVLDVSPPNSVIHNPRANAIINFTANGVFSSVLEDVNEAQSLLNDAL